MEKIYFAILCTLILSCKEDNQTIEFKRCNFSSNTKVLTLKNKQGIINYSKSIDGVSLNEYTYYIKTDNQLPLTICNMPESLKIEKNSKMSVTFSGRMEVLDDHTDAISTRIELTDLKF